MIKMVIVTKMVTVNDKFGDNDKDSGDDGDGDNDKDDGVDEDCDDDRDGDDNDNSQR